MEVDRLCPVPNEQEGIVYHCYDKAVKTCILCHEFTPNGYNRNPICTCEYPEVDLTCLSCHQTSKFSHTAYIAGELTFVGGQYGHNPMFGNNRDLPKDAICLNCGQKADTWSTLSPFVDFNRGGFLEPFCQRCVLEHQIEIAQKSSDKLPALQAELKKLS